MPETNKMLHKYVTDLLKYSENSGVFNPDFTTQEIPEIFSGWSVAEFNKVHHGAGAGCCIYIAPERYTINIAHCSRLHNEFTRHHEIQKKLEELKKPHWIAKYGFGVGLIAMAAACIAAYFSAFPRSSQPSAVIQTVPVIKQSVQNVASSSRKP